MKFDLKDILFVRDYVGDNIYQERTKDKTGALIIQGSVPPGSRRDVTPSWLVAEASLHNKNEHQRNERVAQDLRHRPSSGQGDEGGKSGKGGKGKWGQGPPSLSQKGAGRNAGPAAPVTEARRQWVP